MNKLIISILTVTLLASCNSKNEKTNKMTDKKKQTEKYMVEIYLKKINLLGN